MNKLIVFVLIIIGVLVIFKFGSEGNDPPTGVDPAGANGSQQGQVSPPNQLAPSAPLLTPFPTQTALQRLQAVAEPMDIYVQVTQQSGNEVHAQVEWMGDVATIGGDYLEQLLREGVIKDFNANTSGQRWYDDQSRSRWVQNFVLKMR